MEHFTIYCNFTPPYTHKKYIYFSLGYNVLVTFSQSSCTGVSFAHLLVSGYEVTVKEKCMIIVLKQASVIAGIKLAESFSIGLFRSKAQCNSMVSV